MVKTTCESAGLDVAPVEHINCRKALQEASVIVRCGNRPVESAWKAFEELTGKTTDLLGQMVLNLKPPIQGTPRYHQHHHQVPESVSSTNVRRPQEPQRPTERPSAEVLRRLAPREASSLPGCNRQPSESVECQISSPTKSHCTPQHRWCHEPSTESTMDLLDGLLHTCFCFASSKRSARAFSSDSSLPSWTSNSAVGRGKTCFVRAGCWSAAPPMALHSKGRQGSHTAGSILWNCSSKANMS